MNERYITKEDLKGLLLDKERVEYTAIVSNVAIDIIDLLISDISLPYRSRVDFVRSRLVWFIFEWKPRKDAISGEYKNIHISDKDRQEKINLLMKEKEMQIIDKIIDFDTRFSSRQEVFRFLIYDGLGLL